MLRVCVCSLKVLLAGLLEVLSDKDMTEDSYALGTSLVFMT